MNLIAEGNLHYVIRMAGLYLVVACLTAQVAKLQAAANARRWISCCHLPDTAFYCRFPVIA